jgi:hypothetical protein
MAIAERISEREQIQNDLVEYLECRGNLNAPYGILYGVQKNANGKGAHRAVTFGKSRTLDATVLIFSKTNLVFRWQGALLNRSNGRDSLKFETFDDLIRFLDEAL